MAGLRITRSTRIEGRETKPNPATWERGSESVSPTTSRPSGASRRMPSTLEDTPARSGQLHEQPVGLRSPPGNPITAHMVNHAVDLSDLQNYLSWDMYGIMEMSDSGLKAGIEGNSMPSWTGAT
jgi:hypothetical protein